MKLTRRGEGKGNGILKGACVCTKAWRRESFNGHWGWFGVDGVCEEAREEAAEEPGDRAGLLQVLFIKKRKVDFYLDLFLAASLHWNKLCSKVFFYMCCY